MADNLRYLNDLKKTTDEFWTDQVDNWERVWKRVKADNYTFGNWMSDALQTWDSWVSAGLRYGSLRPGPSQNVVPTIVLLSDVQADSPQGEAPAPPGLKYDDQSVVQSTAFVPKPFGDNFKIDAKVVKDTRSVKVRVAAQKAGAEFKDVADPTFKGQTGEALIFQGTLPIARVILSFKK